MSGRDKVMLARCDLCVQLFEKEINIAPLLWTNLYLVL